ncbi:MAG: GntR family transcriptional regulator [Ruminiclostridium sp.]|nr:GntR family transcriptional regulator [Ruminiclostridium sp.]
MPWDFRPDIPIYTQLIDQIQRQMVTGQLAPGDRLPSVRDLATQAGVNPNTMQRALTELERRSLVYSQRTSGRFVTEDGTVIQKLKEDTARTQVRDFLAGMAQLGLTLDEILTLIQTEGEPI